MGLYLKLNLKSTDKTPLFVIGKLTASETEKGKLFTVAVAPRPHFCIYHFAFFRPRRAGILFSAAKKNQKRVDLIKI